ncbi:hypothetical protein GOP47_0005533 [Adiantum capillus-veneris]|uniref:Nucleosome assembly protein n=1 Tax=Adiantum capillus-veneris TaxID=13818 RepID=A0A9D4V5A9_ADICA|nr:hypothetical protein GOP47_0005533 [Adiantum capillus-veneris]
MSSNSGSLSVSDLHQALPADRAGLVNMLKDKLQSLAGEQSSLLDSLAPNVRKRVFVLQEIQGQYDELEQKFFEERAALEARYQKLYEPLYLKRYEIVNGITEAEGVVEEEVVKSDASAEQKEAATGVPEFWLNAMKTNERLAIQITDRDEEALKFLKDIRWSKVEDPKGFKLEFLFDNNPFFKNTTLSKEYHMIEEDEPILERAVGTEIEWNAGKNLTQKVMRKKVKKGAKNVKPITKTEACESFFNFFSPPQVPEDDEEIDQEKAEELQEIMEQDYEIGSTIRDKIIPHAVSWYTGEAVEGEEFEDVEESGDLDDDDEDEDEGEEDEQDACREK